MLRVLPRPQRIDGSHLTDYVASPIVRGQANSWSNVVTLARADVPSDRPAAEHPDIDGLFVANDLMADGALQALRDLGRRVPEDVAVVGFDNSVAALACRPQLTTIHQPVEEMAAEMARLLVAQIRKPDTRATSVIFHPASIKRQSA